MKQRKNVEERRAYARERYRQKRDEINKRRKELRQLRPDIYHAIDKRGHQKPKKRWLYSQNRAQKRGLTWLIEFDDYVNLIQQPCHYCNNLLGQPVTNGVGLDRINNTIGYELTNVVSCCGPCNILRGDFLSHEEAKQVIEFLLKLRGLIT